MTESYIFFAYVSDGQCDGLFLGYGEMTPTGRYALMGVDIGKEMDAQLWLDPQNAQGSGLIDVVKDFSIERDLFKPPYRPDKRDWEDMSGFTLVSRCIWDTYQSVEILERAGVDTVMNSFDSTEAAVRESEMPPQTAYQRIADIHMIRDGFKKLMGEREGATRRRSVGDILKSKLKDKQGGKT